MAKPGVATPQINEKPVAGHCRPQKLAPGLRVHLLGCWTSLVGGNTRIRTSKGKTPP